MGPTDFGNPENVSYNEESENHKGLGISENGLPFQGALRVSEVTETHFGRYLRQRFFASID